MSKHEKDRPSGRRGRPLGWIAAACLLLLALGVAASRQFPGLFGGPRTSTELLEDLFRAPSRIVMDPWTVLLERMGTEAVVLFVRSCDLHGPVEDRLVTHLSGERFQQQTVPFLFYLYELYGAALRVEPEEVMELSYAESPPPTEARGGPGLSALVRSAPRLRRQARVTLELYDALFLQLRPDWEEQPTVRERYEEAAYEEIKAIVRSLAEETLLREDRGADHAGDDNEYREAIDEILKDDDRLGVSIQFLTDFVRQLSESWLDAFARRETRRSRRIEWVGEQIAANRYHHLADWAAARSSRRLVFHLAVDGLQGQLLEGLARLSDGDAESGAARYVTDLVRQHREPAMDPGAYDSGMPPALGPEAVEIVTDVRRRPEYLPTFKRYCFSPEASSVVVHVATVDTPSISVRNLPIIQSGHGVAGPYGTGIPNFSYLDRPSGLGWYFWGSDALHLPDIFLNREDRIPGGRNRPESPGARTLFQRLWRYNTVSAMSTLDEGASEKISAEVGLVVGELERNFSEKLLVLRFQRRGAMELELQERRRWLMEHRHLSHSFLGALLFDARDLATFRQHAEFLAEHEDEGLPDYLLWYNPWPDHFAHGAGPYSDDILGHQGEYDRLDFYLGKMVEIYEESGAFDRTLFATVSDHGLIYTPRLVSTDELLFRGMERDGLEVRYEKLTHDEGGLPALRDRRRVEPSRSFDAVVGSTAGGSYIIDLFDHGRADGDRSAWQRHPGYHQLQSHTLLSGQAIDWIAELRGRLRDSMDLALVREYGPEPETSWPADVESVVRVITPDRGDARISRLRTSEGTRYRYEVLGDQDPLDLTGSVRDYLIAPGGVSVAEVRAGLESCIGRADGCREGEWQELLSTTLRPDAIHQYSQIYDSPRAGTINVFPLRHVGMNSSVPGRHAGESFGEKNGVQVYWGAGLERSRIQTARNGSVPVTLYHWLMGGDRLRAPDPDTGVPPAEQFAFPSLIEAGLLVPDGG